MEPGLWNPGCGILAVESWLLKGWLWKPVCGILGGIVEEEQSTRSGVGMGLQCQQLGTVISQKKFEE